MTERRTAADFAQEMKWLVDCRYPEAEVIRVVLDNLNIHSPASLYQAFSPEEARRLTKKLEFHHTPKHASWLNMNELELAVLSRPCFSRRLGSREAVAREVGAWEQERNAARASVTWRFTTAHARTRDQALPGDHRVITVALHKGLTQTVPLNLEGRIIEWSFDRLRCLNGQGRANNHKR